MDLKRVTLNLYFITYEKELTIEPNLTNQNILKTRQISESDR